MSKGLRDLGKVWLLGAGLMLGWLSLTTAQDTAPEPDPFESQSVAYRTALHYDPSLHAPLDQLLKLYREKGRLAELKAIYESHISQYPTDAGAKAVLVRIFQEENDPQVGNLILQAVQQHPDHAYLHYLYFQHLSKESDPAAAQALSKAIDLEPRPDRRLEWIEVLLQETTGTEDRKLAEAHLEKLREAQQGSAGGLEALAEKMHRYGFPEMGLETIGHAIALNPNPESRVNLEMLGAKMEASMGKPQEAGERLSKLLEGVAPDYWRRSEIVSLRISLLNSDSAREGLLKIALDRYERDPDSVEAALDLVELQMATGLRRDAAEVLTEAAHRIPHSQPLEQKALEVLGRLGEDERTLAFLEKRLEAFPERLDLRYRMVQVLYLTGDQASAEAEFETVCEGLTGEPLLERRLDLARYLRRMNLTDYAIGVFEKIVDSSPERLDLRRELAEAHLAVGNREAGRRVVSDWNEKGSSLEHFLDFVRLMVQQDFLREAKDALESRVERNADSMDLRLLLADVLGKFGDQRKGALQLEEARVLADTTALYRQWLETAMQFYEEFDGEELFFDQEQQRVLGESEEWSKEQIARFLTLCEVGELSKQTERVAQMLRAQLNSGELPEELEVEVRRLLVRTLDEDPAYSLEVEAQLETLLDTDPSAASDYLLRLALLYHSNQRPDLARPKFEQVNFEEVGDPKLLKECQAALADYEMYTQLLTSLRRLVTLEARVRGHWEKLLNMLAATDREVEFRQVLWRLLNGGQDLELNDDTIQAMRLHLADSYWRSISRAMHDPDSSPAQVMPLLDALERSVGNTDDQLWALWARSFLLNQMGQTEARDQVVQMLMDRCVQAELTEIAFPDGLAISLEAAERVLKEPPAPAPEKVAMDAPVNAGLQMGWGFEVDPGAVILDVEPMGESVLVLDSRRTIYALERGTGKLLWAKRTGANAKGALPPVSTRSSVQMQMALGQGGSITYTQAYGSSSTSSRTIISQLQQTGQTSYSVDYSAPQTMRPLRLESDQSQRFFFPDEHSLSCYDAKTGNLIWSAPILEAMGSSVSGVARPPLEYAYVGDQLQCFDPSSGMAAALEASSGKILWIQRLSEKEKDDTPKIRAAMNSGAAMGPERMVVFGGSSAILDSRTGETLWRLDGETPRRFPMQLNTAQEDEAAEVMSIAINQLPTRYVNHLTSAAGRKSLVGSFMNYRAALVAPASAWASQGPQDGQPRMAALQGRKLLLMGPQGMGVYSLDLPLAGKRISVMGTYLGGEGDRACVLSSSGIEIVDLETGAWNRIPLSRDGNERIEVLVQGNRIYAGNAKGLRCWNLHTGRRIFEVPWPERLIAYSQKHNGFAMAPSFQFLWQGVASTAQLGNSSARVCYPIRSQAQDGTLYMMVSERVLAVVQPLAPSEEG